MKTIQRNVIRAWNNKKRESKQAIDTLYPQLWNEQKHTVEGSEANAYYMYGYYSALAMVIEKLEKKENDALR